MVDHSPFKADAGVRFSYRVPDELAMNRNEGDPFEG